MEIKNIIKNIKNTDMKDFLRSKQFKAMLYGFAATTIALLIFQAGIFVGYHKAEFSYRWGDNYSRTFGELRNGSQPLPGMTANRFPSANGIIGKIIGINLPNIIVEGRDNVERIIMTDDDTSVRSLREEINPSDLKINDDVVVIGSPDEKGQIQARLIRLMPSEQTAVNISTTTRTK